MLKIDSKSLDAVTALGFTVLHTFEELSCVPWRVGHNKVLMKTAELYLETVEWSTPIVIQTAGALVANLWPQAKH